MKVILAIDLGTTGNRVIAFTRDGRMRAKSYYEFPQIFPRPGWVEHNPLDIWKTTRRALEDVVKKVGAGNVAAVGITNQRETAVLWDRNTGKPVYNAIVWQCRRTSEMCAKYAAHAPLVRRKTGLFIDPYFSATKIRWMIDNVPGVKKGMARGDVVFGTIDAWILWKLTGGRVHATEPSNAARTLCFNIHTMAYDPELLGIFGLPGSIFPQVKESGGDFGVLDKKLVGREIPVTGILGDQQASLFAQGGWERGVVKNTYGTGLFLMAAVPDALKDPGPLVTTVAWKTGGEARYALEGSVFVGGSSLQWLRDGLKIITASPETEDMARSLPSNEGVYFVPALTGLGAPYWDPAARGMIIGLTRGTRREHIARAALEGIAYQVKDVVEAMGKISGERFKRLRVDGGASRNDFLMQFQADILGVPIERPRVIETTALGAAGIAGISSGFWSRDEFLKTRRVERVFSPVMKKRERESYYCRWKEAVQRAMKWAC
ncbi:MAG: glycerol kinase GlpK [Endomicrobiales bacterium]